jgi:urocanate hydratase
MYVPNGMGLEEAETCAGAIPESTRQRSMQAMAAHCRAMVEMQAARRRCP